MPFLTLARHRLHYRIDGDDRDKPWLVFCNSLGTDLHMWDAQAEALADRFRILRYDRRGHGRSTAPPPPYGLADLGADLLTLMDALGIARAHFCGLSIGGLVGQWLARQAADRLDRVVLCATASRIGRPADWESRIRLVEAEGLEPLLSGTVARWFTPGFAARGPQTVDAFLATFAATAVPGYLGCCHALAGADLTATLGSIRHPVLAISGDDDPVCPPADLEAIARSVADGRHRTLPGRHIVNVESADAFTAALRDFLVA